MVYAVEAQDVDFGTDLSGPVTAAAGVVDAVLAELAEPGARAEGPGRRVTICPVSGRTTPATARRST